MEDYYSVWESHANVQLFCANFFSCFAGYTGKYCVTISQDMPFAFFVNGSSQKSTNMAYEQFYMTQERKEILRKVGEQ